jgi:hypothetical protein
MELPFPRGAGSVDELWGTTLFLLLDEVWRVPKFVASMDFPKFLCDLAEATNTRLLLFENYIVYSLSHAVVGLTNAFDYRNNNKRKTTACFCCTSIYSVSFPHLLEAESAKMKRFTMDKSYSFDNRRLLYSATTKPRRPRGLEQQMAHPMVHPRAHPKANRMVRPRAFLMVHRTANPTACPRPSKRGANEVPDEREMYTGERWTIASRRALAYLLCLAHGNKQDERDLKLHGRVVGWFV